MDHNFVDFKTLASRNVEDASGIAAVRGSIAERRAAKCGFNAERISTARFRTTSPLASPAAAAVRSPCITIPPGISPAALLHSPILLPNSQLSPTTGTFPLGFLDFDSSVLNAASMSVESSLRQKPHANSDSLLGFSSLENQGNGSDFQDPALGEQSMDFEFPADFCKKADTKNCIEELATDAKVVNAMVTDADLSDVQMSCPDVASNRPSLPREQVNGDNAASHNTLEEHNGMFPATGSGRTSEDGYNWRKYGQKQVKGSEYPRSYYKCTHPNCLVKKKIERSHDGQITEIIYKGAHNHPKPQPSRRTQLGSSSSLDEMPETDGGSGISAKVEGGSAWKDMESGRADGLERTSSASVVTELSDPLSTTQGKSVGTFESAETPELSSTLASRDDDDEEDQATHGSVSLGVDANDEESASKRRKIEGCYLETNLVSRAVREPRVVVQIESEVDILDDGYRWRKYGQKVVKGNPNPRSYYKCTSAGCLVRKHVERASHDLKYVITTYEGKHNHDVPAARNSTNINTSSVNLNQVTANQQPPLLARNTTVPKPEIQLQDFIPGFDRKSMFHNDYFGTNFPGNFASDVKIGTSSIYPMKFPSMQSTMPYGSFGFNSNCGAGNLSGSISSLVPEFQISLPMSLHTSPSLPLAGADFSNNGNSVGQVQAFLPGQPLIRPKQEQKDDSSYDHGMSGIDHVNASSSASSLYHHIRGNCPS